MRSVLLAASLSLAFVAPAFGDAPEMGRDLPALVREALGASHDGHEDDLWRFTLTADYGDTGGFSARFDSTRPEGERWTLISPANSDAMSDDLREQWVDLSTPDEDEADDSADSDDEESGQSFGIGGDGSGLFFSSDTVDLIGGRLAQTRRANGLTEFSFQPEMNDEDDEDGEDNFSRFLSGELTVADRDPYVQRIRIFAPASFKPHPVARVHEFEMVMEFERIDGLPAPIVRAFSTHVDVSALFQRQTQNIRFEFSEVEYEAR